LRLRPLLAACLSLASVASAQGGRLGAGAPPLGPFTLRRFIPPRAVADTDTVKRPTLGDALGGADLDLALQARFEGKLDRSVNERCAVAQTGLFGFTCRGAVQPRFDVQFNVRTSGTVADRVGVDVDYDTQREFDANNAIAVRYLGRDGEFLRSAEVGNVSFAPPPSRFITSGVPSNNYGVQAEARWGAATLRGIVAQQRGTVTRDFTFTVGGRATRREERDLDDYQVEPRRFFFTVDPVAFGAAWPDIDLLDATRLTALAAALPDSLRPSRVFLYRLLIGAQPPDPNGPRFTLLDDPLDRAGPPYEVLREGVDYYTDPSRLWVALARPLNLANERLVIAYTVRLGGRDTVLAHVGGTPDLAFVPGRPQRARLLWDPQLRPADPAFRREIRSVYRLAGEDLRRSSVELRIAAGPGAGLERPVAGGRETLLQMFGLAQATNPARFDAENRVWPRPGDPIAAVAAGTGQRVLRDYFVIFPSARPFARDGLVDPGNPANDSIYTVPGDYLYSAQHPAPVYRLRVRYELEGGSGETLALGTVQLRANSERIAVDGVLLRRDVDYTMDYELGRVTFTRPDTLFPRARTVTVRYEDNPLFVATPTDIVGLATSFRIEHGTFDIVALAQSQRTTFTRPPLGYEPQSSLLGGVIARFAFDAPLLTRWLRGLPGMDSTRAASRLEIGAELAASRPQPNRSGQAFVESFEGDGGFGVPLLEAQWGLSSQPARGRILTGRLGAGTLDLARAATLAWQNVGTDRLNFPVTFTIGQIDPQTTLAGAGVDQPETLLWLGLYPLAVGGLADAQGRPRWTIDGAPSGRRWRSVRTTLSPAGADLTRAEQVEFWTLADVTAEGRLANPTLILDVGEVSENTVAIAPERLTVTDAGGTRDSTFRGRRLVGLDTLDSERDAFSRAFDQARDDRGIPGDRVPTLTVTDAAGTRVERDVSLCARGNFRLYRLGDAGAACTARNSRLDEEDIDLDGALNLTQAQREQERVFRYVVDLADPRSIARTGRCGVPAFDTIPGGAPVSGTRCWVQVRVPFRAADDTLNGGPDLRRVRALRVTVVSGVTRGDGQFTVLPLGRLRFAGAPWIKRSERALAGIAGDRPGIAYVRASVIGTQDRDTLRGIDYVPPPGVSDEAEQTGIGLQQVRVQVNERSLRVQTGGTLRPFERAEAYYRFPEGDRNFLAYRELRLWGRGRGAGWGADGDLQLYVKVGRDQDNFYFVRTPVNEGRGQAAWLPEVRVRFDKLTALRARIQRAVLRGDAESLQCTGVDSVLVARAGLPLSGGGRRFAACEDGYIAYAADPTVNPPNLAAVQELAVGIVRVDSTGGVAPIVPSDTLELWIDDIRLADPERTVGVAGELDIALTAGDVARVRARVARRDPYFRQLNEQPTFVGDDALELGATVRLDRLLPGAGALALPLTLSFLRSASDPLYVTRSDLPGDAITGLRTPRADRFAATLGLRRATPLTGAWYAPFVNNVGVSVTWTRDASRAEFLDGGRSLVDVGLDFAVADATVAGGRRWVPSEFRVSSRLAQAADRRRTFLRPALAVDDTGFAVSAVDRLWRTTSSLAWAPLPAITARWDVTSARDLRSYGGDDAQARAARAAGDGGLGLERERTVTTTVGWTPLADRWLRPRAELTASYLAWRDPNNRALLGDTAAATPRLARRLAGTQALTTGVGLDLARASGATDTLAAGWRAWLARLRPIDASWSRALNGFADAAAGVPALATQFGFAGIGDFRRLDGTSSTLASQADQGTLAGAYQLPGAVTLSARANRADTRSWIRRDAVRQARVDGRQATWPDVGAAWTWRGAEDGVLRDAAASARFVRTHQRTVQPAELAGGAEDRRVTLAESVPLAVRVTWGALGGLSTAVAWTRQERVDTIPGSVTTATANDFAADVARDLSFPASWKMRSDLRVRVGYEHRDANAFVADRLLLGPRSRLADNGRTALTFSADTDVAENLLFTLQGSRVVTFDENLNRRFSQFVLSAALNLQFYGGGR
jgi:hypothetical protein